jgi:cyanophycin synthetase
VTVSRLLSARVIGDGLSSVASLVQTVNQSRTEKLSSAGVKIKLDEMAENILRRQGMTVSSVPAHGQIVVLRSNANLSTGGTGERMNDVAHPDVLRLAERAAMLFGLDFAGIDYLTTDVTRSPQETGGAICEVNVTPGWVNMGDPVALTRELLAPFFPAGDDGRIPIVCLLAPSGSAHALSDALPFLFDGQVARADQVKFWSAQADRAPAPLHRRVSAALADPLATAAVISCTPEEVVMSGLGLERCTVTILMPGVAGDAVEAVLRVTQVAVVSACVATSMPDVLSAAACRTWIVGEPPTSIIGRCTGWIRRAKDGTTEVCTVAGEVSRITDPGSSDEDIWFLAAGVALNLPPSKVATALRSVNSKRLSA